ncbi:MAG: hypothetical protein ACPGVT_03720 [Maricaulaceae bacterium]
MKQVIIKGLILASTATLLNGCMAAKMTTAAVTLPVKAVYKTGKFAGKGVYYTGKAIGKGTIKTSKFAANDVYPVGKAAGKNVGKGIYYVGKIPVQITDKALDTSAKILSITTQTVDLAGKTVVLSREIQASKLDSELGKLKTAKNIISVFVDAVL